MNKIERQQNWSNYWKKHFADSCCQGIESENSDIEQFWLDCALALNTGSKVLDLCTGKGDAIRKLIDSQIKLGRDISSFTGVDLSEVDKGKVKDKFTDLTKNVDFFYNTSIEDMPFKSGAFDVVISQFGLEYSLNHQTLKEVFRVLTEGGTARFIVHHAESVLTDVAKDEHQHTTYLLEDSSFFSVVEKLIPVFAKLRNPANIEKLKQDKEAIELRKRFNIESNLIASKIESSAIPDVLQESLTLSDLVFRMAREQGAAKAKEKLQEFIKELEQSNSRIEELIEAALTKKELIELCDTVKQFGRNVESMIELRSDNHKVAWGLILS
ncbi:class I SAM-dependent methyltransferase [Kangiella shandongensis]|uniref:class I SAM-dependent methyltransferase n=1 Tax=Kangiella shandongensis TaxID=2763258 RepID=UPI001CBBFA4C|nr:class I SAM-dependent methyltransferase [Kangiella shandongensis]